MCSSLRAVHQAHVLLALLGRQRTDLHAERVAPEIRRGREVVGAAVDDEAGEPALVHVIRPRPMGRESVRSSRKDTRSRPDRAVGAAHAGCQTTHLATRVTPSDVERQARLFHRPGATVPGVRAPARRVPLQAQQARATRGRRAEGDGVVRVGRETKGRKGKGVTVVTRRAARGRRARGTRHAPQEALRLGRHRARGRRSRSRATIATRWSPSSASSATRSSARAADPSRRCASTSTSPRPAPARAARPTSGSRPVASR